MIQIIPYDATYQEQILKLILTIQQDEFKVSITAADQPDLTTIPEFYQQGSGNFWVALHAQEVIGTVSLLDIGNRQVALRKMFVKKEFRGAHWQVAGRLLKTALDWSRQHQLSKIFLGTTPQFLAAHRFYEKNGFEQVSQQSLPAAFPIMKVDTRFYCYAI